jgi:hypothetical protein
MPEMNTAEKIETIVLSYLMHRTTEGEFGTVVVVEPFSNGAASFMRCYRVVADGKTFIVRVTPRGWAVFFGPFVGEAKHLYDAAKLVVDEKPGGGAPHQAAR